MKLKIIAGVFVGLVYALAVFLTSGFALICFSALSNLRHPGSVDPGETGWRGLIVELYGGGILSLSNCIGGLILLIIAAAMHPLLFENKIRFVVRWGCLTSVLSFIWIWIFCTRFYPFDPLMVPILIIFTWFFIRHYRKKAKNSNERSIIA